MKFQMCIAMREGVVDTDLSNLGVAVVEEFHQLSEISFTGSPREDIHTSSSSEGISWEVGKAKMETSRNFFHFFRKWGFGILDVTGMAECICQMYSALLYCVLTAYTRPLS